MEAGLNIQYVDHDFKIVRVRVFHRDRISEQYVFELDSREDVFMQSRILQNAFSTIFAILFRMPLRCPFCNAEEDDRVDAIDHSGKHLVLIMFDCPFAYRFSEEQMGSDDSLQARLNEWRKREGEAWLESLGPVIREREMRGIQRYEKSLQSN